MISPNAPVPIGPAGSKMRGEMREQAQVLGTLAARAAVDCERLRGLVPKRLAGVTLVARGSSGNAAILGRYLIERASRRPASVAAPALQTLYHANVDYRGYVAVALSQSGATPEITNVLDAMGRAGARTAAVTNDPRSPLASVAELVYGLDAGPELAVPATKTVTAQMLAMLALSGAFGANGVSPAVLAGFRDHVEEVLATPASAVQLAATWVTGIQRLFVVSRGYGYPAALEAALKITETSGLQAQGFSAADLRHGPIAGVNDRSALLIIDTGGPGSSDLMELAEVVQRRGAALSWCSPRPHAELSLPAGLPEPLAAILATIRGQQLALGLSLALGRDPDTPPGLSKVTATR